MYNEVNLSDLPKRDNAMRYGITDTVMLHIHDILSKFGQDSVLTVGDHEDDIESLLADGYSDEDFQIYDAYGIVFHCKGTLRKNMFSMLILSEADLASEQTLASKYEQLCRETSADDRELHSIMIEADLSEIDATTKSSYSAMLNSMFPNVIILNPGVVEMYDNTSVVRDNNFNYIDVTDDLVKCTNLQVTMSSKISSILEFLRSIEETVTSNEYSLFSRVIFCVDSSKLDNYTKCIYAAVAAYITSAYGVPFEIPSDLNDFYRNYLGMLHSQNYMYFEDYLEDLLNPLDIGLMNTGSFTSICVRYLADEKQTPIAKRVNMRIEYVAFDTKMKSIISSELGVGDFTADDIEVESLAHLYGLGEEVSESSPEIFERQKKSIDDLSKTLEEFEAMIIEKALNATTGDTITLGKTFDSILTVSNTVLFKHNNTTYLGYVADIKCSYLYTVQPLIVGYKPIISKFSIEDYHKLNCTGVVTNSLSYLANDSFMNMVRNNKLVAPYRMTRHQRAYQSGIVLASIAAVQVTLDVSCELTPEQIGFWSSQTSSVRRKYRVLLQKFTHKMLRAHSFLSCFGGPMPTKTFTLTVQPNEWR